MKSITADQIFDATPFWYWMRANGMLEKVEGGRFLTEPLRFAKSDNVEFIRRGSSVDLSDKEFMTLAKDDWRYMVDSIVRFGVDDQQNRGKNAILSLANAKMDNSKDTLIDTMETRLAGAAGTDQFNGLQDIVPDAPATTACHGIDPAVYTWWRSQEDDFATNWTTFDADGVMVMNKMVNACSNNRRQDTPDIILSGQHPFELYWEETLEQRRVVNKTMGDAGFQNIEFRGIPMIWSPAIPSENVNTADARMYFLNTRFLKFKYDPMMFFDMTAWKDIPNQVNDRAAQIILAGNLMTGRRRVHGVIWNMDATVA
jgi:hypothetical protein